MKSQEIESAVPAFKLMQNQTLSELQTAASLEANLWLKEIAYQLALANERSPACHGLSREK